MAIASAAPSVGSVPGAELVEQAQGIFVRLLQDRDDPGHMGGEGAETLLNALFVPDIRKTSVKMESSERSSAGIWSPA